MRRCIPARDDRYRAWIRLLPCIVCKRYGSEAAHTGRDGGQSQKASDYSCVPLCPECHTFGPQSYHRLGRESFEAQHGLSLTEQVTFFNALFRNNSREA